MRYVHPLRLEVLIKERQLPTYQCERRITPSTGGLRNVELMESPRAAVTVLCQAYTSGLCTHVLSYTKQRTECARRYLSARAEVEAPGHPMDMKEFLLLVVQHCGCPGCPILHANSG